MVSDGRIRLLQDELGASSQGDCARTEVARVDDGDVAANDVDPRRDDIGRVEGQQTRAALLDTGVGAEGEDGDIRRREVVGGQRQDRERGIRRIREDEVIVGRITAADGFRQGPSTVGVQPAGAINREERSQDLVGVR